MGGSLGTWKPLTPAEVARELRGMPGPWWIAGGWAIELHLGQQSPPHDDVDVAVLRSDQLAVQQHFATWELRAADPPGTLRPWREGEVLPVQVHDIWCRRSPSSPWCLQLMIEDSEDDEWIYRRDARIRRPLVELDDPSSNTRHRVLGADIQLLYKSTHPRPKDELDFHAVRGFLDDGQQRWLVETLAITSPRHPWIDRL